MGKRCVLLAKSDENSSSLKVTFAPVTYKEVVIDVDRELLKIAKM